MQPSWFLATLCGGMHARFLENLCGSMIHVLVLDHQLINNSGKGLKMEVLVLVQNPVTRPCIYYLAGKVYMNFFGVCNDHGICLS